MASTASNVFTYLLHSPRTKSKVPKRSVTSSLKPVRNILMKRMVLKSVIGPSMLAAVASKIGILYCTHLTGVASPFGTDPEVVNTSDT